MKIQQHSFSALSDTSTTNSLMEMPMQKNILVKSNLSEKPMFQRSSFKQQPSRYSAPSLDHQLPKVELTKESILIDGAPKILRGGAFQWFKLPKEVWEDRILRFKSAGYNTLDIYVSWRNHEPAEGKFDFEKYDLKYFLELAKKHSLYVVFRPGPYICNEMDSGGLPGWLIAKSRKDIINTETNDGYVNIRTNEKDYLDYVQRYFTKVNEIARPYLHSNGGPIILYSVENEYDWFCMLKDFDKHATINSKPERPPYQEPNVKSYLERLAVFARKDGINVPITTCPGKGKVGSMGDSNDIIPMPNMYTGLRNSEYNTVKLIEDMHSKNHGGIYNNVPAGLTETTREANIFKRLILGGMNSVLQFNNIGFFQDGYQNAILINGTLFDNFKGALENLSKMVSISHPRTAFVRPSIGFFPGKGDYNGSAIGPSGTFRDNFYNIRRTNLFVDSFQELIAKSYKPFRTFSEPKIPDQNRNVTVKNSGTGLLEPDRLYSPANYWMELGRETALISIFNNGYCDRNLGKNSVTAYGNSFPRFTELVVPVEHGNPLSAEEGKPTHEYTMFLPYNFPLSQKIKLNYSTSEILAKKDIAKEKLLVVYGKTNTPGELRISGKNLKINSMLGNIKVEEKDADSFTISYKHGIPLAISYSDEDGKNHKIVILDTHLAGKTWFVDTPNEKAMISGADYVNTLNSLTTLDFSSQESNDKLVILSTKPINIPETQLIHQHNDNSCLSIYKVNKAIPDKLFNINISQGRVMRDIAEISPDFDTKDWIHIGDKPQNLEKLGIYTGHSWYRAEFSLNKNEIQDKNNLWIEHAGDFEGIYINGNYINTLTPIGTEIRNNSKDASYNFKIPPSVLKEGKNTIAFKNEIWGHGGILLPQGTFNRFTAFGHSFKIPFVKLRIPYMSYDSLKGISGDTKFNNKQIVNWKVRHGLGGNLQEFHKPGFKDDKWAITKTPLTLNKGEIIWYRTNFNYNDLPNGDKWFAPLALTLKGVNSKATIYLNGRLIGRWISDDKWLSRGGWFVPVKNMWTASTTDEFPIPQNVLRKGNNSISIVFEDTSSPEVSSVPGKINEIKMNVATETTRIIDGKTFNVQSVYKKLPILR